MEDILLTFTGFQDPYSLGLIGEEEQLGPILSLLREKSFNQVFLFSTPRTVKNTLDTKREINSIYPKITVNIIDISWPYSRRARW